MTNRQNEPIRLFKCKRVLTDKQILETVQFDEFGDPFSDIPCNAYQRYITINSSMQQKSLFFLVKKRYEELTKHITA